ncbi:phosphatidylinositol-specific phospholipase C1-like protein [Acetobacteraceae bacterium KSS8]|uniref:Phosphatidylinositol-specific phospholipase C1-like protein n=1 Tax=Endosaccharibacter trunci TaxID=2812733 RepID=A0ABT1W749_9PROT|nr:phosphatidylinositol-specific phospholipase C1-like protein [Acetobacteraceae bacterium KSS8]
MLARRTGTVVSIAALLCGLSCRAPAAMAQDDPETLRINQIQVIGTHNSYRDAIDPATLRWLDARKPAFAQALDYRHATIDAQLDSGIRQIEIDIYADSEGGRYAHPRGPEWIRATGMAAPTQDGVALLSGNDFKVMHIVDLDQRSSCEPLRACLDLIRRWSDAHPNHLPLFVDLETKQDAPAGTGLPFTAPEIFTTATYDRLDREILDAIGRDRLMIPDDVRGTAPTLDAAVRAHGWPFLSKARGKMIFLFDRPHDTGRYVVDHPALRGRIVFTNSRPGDPDGAFTEINDPVEGADRIAALVKAGYLVRTRADADTAEARAGKTTRRDAALRSGAQLISTDYPASEPAPWHGYKVALPGGAIARIDPVNGPPDAAARAGLTP